MDSAQKAYTSDNSSKEILLNFFEELQLIGAEFGYRSAFEINRFSSILKEIGESINDDQIMDYAIMQKLLPKIHGSRRKLEPVLRKLMELCCEDRSELEDLIARKKTLSESDPAIKYHVSFRKLLSMFWSMSDNGFTSYTEA
jgi:5-methylcytosine-specific restriction protein B